MGIDHVVMGRVVTPETIIEDGWVAITGDRIGAVGEGAPPSAARCTDMKRAWIMPGGIDAQSHAGSYWGLPGLAPTTRAAAAGGVTTIVDMPFDTPTPLNTMELFHAKREAVERLAVCDVALYATVAPGQTTDAMEPLAEAGVCGFKISVCESHPTRFPRIPADQQWAILQKAAQLGLPVGLHNEDQEVVRACTALVRQQGLDRNPLLSHDRCRPEAAELAATAGFITLAEAAGAHAHIVHISTPRGFDLLRRQPAGERRATGEICIHYLIFDPLLSGEEFGAKLKVNPPLRPGARERLWERAAAGEVTCVSSDHSTMSLANKESGPFFDAGPGMPGLQAMIPGFFTGAQTRGLDAPRLAARLFSEQPAKLFGLWPRKGGLLAGADADIVVLQPDAVVYGSAEAQDEVGWSPYEGMRFDVRVAATFVRGEMVWDGGRIVAAAGFGRFVGRK